MTILYRRDKPPDKFTRAYLTLACSRACTFCSADVTHASAAQLAAYVPPETWAEGILRIGNKAILAGGEPLLYEGIETLLELLYKKVPLELYSNMEPPIPRKMLYLPSRWLISCHALYGNGSQWWKNVMDLFGFGHSVRFHIVKVGDWRERAEWLKDAFGRMVKITGCGDQSSGVKSSSPTQTKTVDCSCGVRVYGPCGNRYPCVRLLGMGRPQDRVAFILDPDQGPDFVETRCARFGGCCFCDNLIPGVARPALHNT